MDVDLFQERVWKEKDARAVVFGVCHLDDETVQVTVARDFCGNGSIGPSEITHQVKIPWSTEDDGAISGIEAWADKVLLLSLDCLAVVDISSPKPIIEDISPTPSVHGAQIFDYLDLVVSDNMVRVLAAEKNGEAYDKRIYTLSCETFGTLSSTLVNIHTVFIEK